MASVAIEATNIRELLQQQLQLMLDALQNIGQGGAVMQAGTWAPEVSGGTTKGICNYNAPAGQVGHWRKLGDVCYFWINVAWDGHTGTGELRVTLPFTAKDEVNLVAVVEVVGRNLTQTAGTIDLEGLVQPGTLYVILRSTQNNAGLVTVPIDATGQLYITGSYLTT